MAWGLSGYNRTGCILVCFKDRFTAKGVSLYGWAGPSTNTTHCPKCREPLVNMGKNFRPPKKNDDREWKRIQVAMMLGYGYWVRQSPRQLHLIRAKQKRLDAAMTERRNKGGWVPYIDASRL